MINFEISKLKVRYSVWSIRNARVCTIVDTSIGISLSFPRRTNNTIIIILISVTGCIDFLIRYSTINAVHGHNNNAFWTYTAIVGSECSRIGILIMVSIFRSRSLPKNLTTNVGLNCAGKYAECGRVFTTTQHILQSITMTICANINNAIWTNIAVVGSECSRIGILIITFNIRIIRSFPKKLTYNVGINCAGRYAECGRVFTTNQHILQNITCANINNAIGTNIAVVGIECSRIGILIMTSIFRSSSLPEKLTTNVGLNCAGKNAECGRVFTTNQRFLRNITMTINNFLHIKFLNKGCRFFDLLENSVIFHKLFFERIN